MTYHVNLFFKFVILFVLVILTKGITYGQGVTQRDTIEKNDHYISVRVVENGEVHYEESYPGCFFSRLSFIPGGKEMPPVFSFCMPYKSYIDSDEIFLGTNFIIAYTFLFENDQFMIIYIDKDDPDEELDSLPPILSQQTLYNFVERQAYQTPLYVDVEITGGSPKPLNKYFDAILGKNYSPDTKRETRVVHFGYCTIVLFNILSSEVNRFMESANSLEVYEIKRVIPK
jgi:hypothetical protein